MTTVDFESKTKELIDNLKGICASYGLGNDGNEFKIITQVFLYKFLNDKFAYEVKQIDKRLEQAENWEQALEDLSKNEYEMIVLELGAKTAVLKPIHLISHLFKHQNEPEFAKLLDDTLLDIAIANNDIFSVVTEGGTKVPLFTRVSEFITDTSKRDPFCKAIINKLIDFNFEHIFNEKYDFFATIFEYLISDYNKDSGGTYAEYYTPHAVARIMAAILVQAPDQNVTCYDPSAGSGTLLMNLAHAIGEDKCSIFSQDISQKSSSLLRLNLILNNLIHSIENIIQGNTILSPYHKESNDLMKFDYIVSNPPFNLDFSDFSEDLDTKANQERFFAGIPNIPKTKKEGMAIYTLFLQHIMYSLSKKGKAAIVVPTGFITQQTGIFKKIRQAMIERRMLSGVISMPSNIFATTGTNVSILFLDKNNTNGNIVLMDASGMGKKIKEGKNQKTVLSKREETTIINTYNNREAKDELSVAVSYEEIKRKKYSFSAGQYFDVKIEYVDITADEFDQKMSTLKGNVKDLFNQSDRLSSEVEKQLEKIRYGN